MNGLKTVSFNQNNGCRDASCRDQSCQNQQISKESVTTFDNFAPSGNTSNYDCDVVRPHSISTTTAGKYEWEQFGNGDVMIKCADTGNSTYHKPYPVQPGYEKIKAKMSTDVLYDNKNGVYVQKDTGVIDNTQLYFVLSNIVQSIDEKALVRLLDQNPSVVNTLYSSDFVNTTSLLHLCAVRGVKELLDTLVSRGAILDIRNNKNETPLHLACRRGILATVRYLIEHGADLHAVDNEGNSCAHFSAQSGSTLVIELLYERGLDLNARNASGMSVGHTMVTYGMNSCLHFVLKHRRIDPTVKDNNEDNMLDHAIRIGEANQCALMLEYVPSLIKTIKPLPDINSLESFKSKARVQTAVKVVQHAQKPQWKRKSTYYLLAFRNFFSIFLSFLLKYAFGYKGAFFGMAVVVIDCYKTYQSSHRLRFDRTPSPFLAGAFLAGLFFTSIASLNLTGFSFTRLVFGSEDGMDIATAMASNGTSWSFVCYVLVMMVAMWWMYFKLMLRGVKGANCGELYTGKIWDIAYDKPKQTSLCLLCYTVGESRHTKHCRLCESCVSDMDHHCLYMLTCVGRHNHRLFILFLIVTVLSQISFVIFALQTFHDLIVPALQIGEPVDLVAILLNNYLIVMCLPPNIISCIWGVSFIQNQIFNISRGQTAYFQSYMNQNLLGTKDKVKNVKDFLAGKRVLSTGTKSNCTYA